MKVVSRHRGEYRCLDALFTGSWFFDLDAGIPLRCIPAYGRPLFRINQALGVLYVFLCLCELVIHSLSVFCIRRGFGRVDGRLGLIEQIAGDLLNGVSGTGNQVICNLYVFPDLVDQTRRSRFVFRIERLAYVFQGLCEQFTGEVACIFVVLGKQADVARNLEKIERMRDQLLCSTTAATSVHTSIAVPGHDQPTGGNPDG